MEQMYSEVEVLGHPGKIPGSWVLKELKAAVDDKLVVEYCTGEKPWMMQNVVEMGIVDCGSHFLLADTWFGCSADSACQG